MSQAKKYVNLFKNHSPECKKGETLKIDDQKEIELYCKKLGKELRNPETAKKAAAIILKMLNS